MIDEGMIDSIKRKVKTLKGKKSEHKYPAGRKYKDPGHEGARRLRNREREKYVSPFGMEESAQETTKDRIERQDLAQKPHKRLRKTLDQFLKLAPVDEAKVDKVKHGDHNLYDNPGKEKDRNERKFGKQSFNQKGQTQLRRGLHWSKRGDKKVKGSKVAESFMQVLEAKKKPAGPAEKIMGAGGDVGGMVAGGAAGAALGAALDGPLPFGDIAGGIIGAAIGSKAGKTAGKAVDNISNAAIRKKKIKEDVLSEVAPPTKKHERMVKHIKKSYAKKGGLSDEEKSIAYATAWKNYKKDK